MSSHGNPLINQNDNRPLLGGENVTVFDRWLANKLMQVIGMPQINLVLWNDEMIYKSPNSVATMKLHDRSAMFKIISNPDINAGDLYSTGRLTIDGDLIRFLEVVYKSLDEASKHSWFTRVIASWQQRPRPNSMSRSLDNIHHHYDLGNDFYRLWLDKEAMQYTCAYYPSAEASLEEAQQAKMHHIARKLQLKPGDKVVEAGCGWGGLARFMAKNYGVQVSSFNISREQIAYARDKAKQQGLSAQVDYIEDDYRNIKGKYDVFVSVGMLEHVGVDNFAPLGEVVNRCLKKDGRGLIHSIGRNRPKLMNGWIERRIFPGAYPPSLKEMMNIFEPYDFSVLDVENIRLHYARTLKHWLERFDQHQVEINEMFDENFIRAWRLYLAGSIAAFTTGDLQLFQIVFNRRESNQVPWTREHIYQ
ncbi:MAG: class I SAM-dependent methyltransferase [Gammaproteobacteria bacterium]|nr:class I SAM-dependent methyltransferase [Gammaproteobacteria bacterium]